MGFLVFIAILAIIVSVHELGHAFAMRKHGVSIEQITLFGFGPKVFEFRVRRWFGDTPVRIRAIPLGAFVEPSDSGRLVMNGLPYAARNEIYGAGIIANIALSIVLVAAAQMTSRSFSMDTLATFLVASALAVAVVAAQRPLSAWLLPLLAIANLALTAWLLVVSSQPMYEAMSGPLGIAQAISHDVAARPTFAEAVRLTGAISLGLGLTNLLPFLPFDGGNIAESVFRAIAGEQRYLHYRTSLKGFLLLPGLLLIVFILSNDVFHIV